MTSLLHRALLSRANQYGLRCARTNLSALSWKPNKLSSVACFSSGDEKKNYDFDAFMESIRKEREEFKAFSDSKAPKSRELDNQENIDVSRESGRDASRGFGRDSRGFGRDSNREFGRDSNREFGRDFNREFSRDSNRESGRSSDRGFGRGSDRGFGRSSDRGFDRDRGRGRDFDFGGDRDSRGRNSDRRSRDLDTEAQPSGESKPFQKVFYEETPENRLSDEESKEFFDQHDLTVEGENVPRPVLDFRKVGLPEYLVKDLIACGYKEPTHIQAQSWPIVLNGRDLISIAATGSGKTMGFVVPAVVHAMAQSAQGMRYGPIALVMAPTRELAQQIGAEARKLGRSLDNGFKVHVVHGGTKKGDQIKPNARMHLLVATPGRLIDLIDSGDLTMNHVTYCVLDEADRMLDMGFEPQIRNVLDRVRADRQLLLFSATFPRAIRSLAYSFLKNPVHITVKASEEVKANPNVEQKFICCPKFEKFDHLVSLVKERPDDKILIFVERKSDADSLATQLEDEIPHLRRRGVKTGHSGLSQAARDRNLEYFRRSGPNVMVATDCYARGLDVPDIDLVINFSMPNAGQVEDYIHRIGRTARGTSRKGTSISFVTDQDRELVPALVKILREVNQEVPEEFEAIVEATERARSRRSQSSNRFRSRSRSSSRSRDWV